MRLQPDELDGTFIPPFDEAEFRRESKSFVPRDALQRVPRRPGGERSDLNRVVALDAILGPQLQAKPRIVGAPAIPR